MADDVMLLRSRLVPVESHARQQRWDKERPWRAATHVFWEGPVVVVDLHDLKAGNAKRAVRTVLEHPADAGAVVFITGRGRHSLRATSAVKEVTHSALRKACTQEPEWSFRVVSPGRVAWISDRDRAPTQLTGGSSWGLLVGFGLLLLAAAVGLWGKLAP